MTISQIKPNMRVYHRDYGIVRVIRKDGPSRVVIERPGFRPLPPSDLAHDDDDDDEEDYNENEVSVRVDALILEKDLSPELKARAEEKMKKIEAERKAKALQEAEWATWKESLPELPKLVQQHLKECCKEGMMSFLTLLHNDPQALDKLKQHALYLLREEMQKVEKQVPELEQDLNTKKDFLAMLQKTKKKKGVKLAATA